VCNNHTYFQWWDCLRWEARPIILPAGSSASEFAVKLMNASLTSSALSRSTASYYWSRTASKWNQKHIAKYPQIPHVNSPCCPQPLIHPNKGTIGLESQHQTPIPVNERQCLPQHLQRIFQPNKDPISLESQPQHLQRIFSNKSDQ
jgi:hypothetical protein